jgi:hypothetical protein
VVRKKENKNKQTKREKYNKENIDIIPDEDISIIYN